MPWKPGQSGNPKGRRAELVNDSHVKELARSHCDAAIETLVAVMKSADKDSARVSAATAVLDRGYGRPAQETTDLSTLPEEILVAELRRRIDTRRAVADGVGAEQAEAEGSH